MGKRINSISDLPERYQQQAREKLGETDTPSKMRNQKTNINGIQFDSIKEAHRYVELLDQLKRGEISDLKLQVEFPLINGFTTATGKRIRGEKYIADFTYNRGREYVVEDVKSDYTRKQPVYRIKKKQMAEKYGIDITET